MAELDDSGTAVMINVHVSLEDGHVVLSSGDPHLPHGLRKRVQPDTEVDRNLRGLLSTFGIGNKEETRPGHADSTNGSCPHPLTTPVQQQHGMCNRCWVAADAQRKTAKS